MQEGEYASRYHLGLPLPRGKTALSGTDDCMTNTVDTLPLITGGIPAHPYWRTDCMRLRSGGGWLRVFAGVPGCLAPSGSSLAGAWRQSRTNRYFFAVIAFFVVFSGGFLDFCKQMRMKSIPSHYRMIYDILSSENPIIPGDSPKRFVRRIFERNLPKSSRNVLCTVHMRVV